MEPRPLEKYQWMVLQRLPHIVVTTRVFEALDEFLEAGPPPIIISDAFLATDKLSYLLHRSVEQLTPRWTFKSKVEKGHDILLEVETRPQKPYVCATTSVFINLPKRAQIDPNRSSKMKSGKLQGAPDDETCYRVCESLGDLQAKLGPGFRITTSNYHYLNRGPEFTVVTGIQENQANSRRVVGYYEKEYHKDWYLVH